MSSKNVNICVNFKTYFSAQWSDLLGQGYSQLRQFFKTSVIPSVIYRYGFSKHQSIPEISSLLEWQYIDNARRGDAIALLSQLIDVRHIIFYF